ncbi:hypothetical protein MIR68_002910 [Amoeboaphelidium protococcarum]|nr:hypothetical protein MIR68_002910 [Amoeboaphelidium protococcarum]
MTTTSPMTTIQLPSTQVQQPNYAGVWFEIAIREMIMEQQNDADQLVRILDLVLLVQDDGFVSDQCFLQMAEWTVDISDNDTGIRIIDFIITHLKRVTKKLQPNRGGSLVLLRLCNELLRRVSSISERDAQSCGKILMLLANVFPTNDRSGLNLGRAFHTDNVTSYDGMDVPLDLRTITDDPDNSALYSLLWRCQEFFSNPPKFCPQASAGVTYLSQKLYVQMKRVLEVVVHNLVAAMKQDANVKSNGDSGWNYTQKYLTSKSVFDLQMVDDVFIAQILTQSLIFLRYLRNHFTIAKQQPSASPSKDDKKELDWIDSLAIAILNSFNRSVKYKSYGSFLRLVFKQEDQWIQWKQEQCPSYEKPPSDMLEMLPLESPQIYKARFNMGTAQLHKLWRLKEGDLKVPDCNIQAFLQPLCDQMDPEAQIEPEYRVSREELFNWNLARLLLQSTPRQIDADISQDSVDSTTAGTKRKLCCDLLGKQIKLFDKKGRFDSEVLAQNMMQTKYQSDQQEYEMDIQ